MPARLPAGGVDHYEFGETGPMGRVRDGIDDELALYLIRQPVFFVATAPSGPDGHINVSPKGLQGTFAVLDRDAVAYLDLTGSGVETIAHLHDDGRIVLMFCSFEGKPRIVRLYGRGSVVLPEDPDFEGLAARFPPRAGTRSVINVAVERVTDSCGYGVPRMRLEGERDDLIRWAVRKGDEGLEEYRAQKNTTSIDGLPGLPGLPARPADPSPAGGE